MSFFFFNDTATTEIYTYGHTLSLHDALPIYGLPVEEAKRAVIARAEGEGWGEGSTVYRLRDWGVSRQRYWGTPIPIVHCAACGPVAVPKDHLPVTLPDDVSFDVPGNPLDRHPTWKHVRSEEHTSELQSLMRISY